MQTTNPDILNAYNMLVALNNQQNNIIANLPMYLSTFPMLSDNDKRQLSMLLDTVAYTSENSTAIIRKAQETAKSLVPPTQRSSRI